MIKNSSKFYFSWLAVILIVAGLLCGSLFAVQQVGRNHADEWKAEAMEAGYNNPIYTVCRGTNPVEYNGEVYIQLMTSENSDSEDFTYYFIPHDTKLDYQTDKPNSIVILADDTSETLMINNQEVTVLNTYGVTYTAIQAEMIIFIALSLAAPPMLIAVLYFALFGFVKRNEEKHNISNIEVDFPALAKRFCK